MKGKIKIILRTSRDLNWENKTLKWSIVSYKHCLVRSSSLDQARELLLALKKPEDEAVINIILEAASHAQS